MIKKSMLCKYQWTKCSSEKRNVEVDLGENKILKAETFYMLLYKRLTAELNTQRVKVRAWKNYISCKNRNDNKAGVVKFMSYKTDFLKQRL